MPLVEDLFTTVYNMLAQRALMTRPAGLHSGIPSVDKALGGGFVRQQLSYLVGDSGVGKSWLTSWFMLSGAMKLAASPLNVPVSGYVLSGQDLSDDTKKAVFDKEGKTPIIVFWSLEMAEFPLVARLTSQLAAMHHKDLDSKLIIQGDLGEPGSDSRTLIAEILTKDIPALKQTIFMEFNATSVAEFRQVLDSLAQMYDIVMVIVDYFRLIDEMAMDGSRVSTQEGRSDKLREIARDYDCHVLSIFDINRQGQMLDQPHRYHMKDGTAANYDADLVITLGVEEGTKQSTDIMRHLKFNVEKGRYIGNSVVDLTLNLATGFVDAFDKSEKQEYNMGSNIIEETK
jgi:replicative DNA helicase